MLQIHWCMGPGRCILATIGQVLRTMVQKSRKRRFTGQHSAKPIDSNFQILNCFMQCQRLRLVGNTCFRGVHVFNSG